LDAHWILGTAEKGRSWIQEKLCHRSCVGIVPLWEHSGLASTGCNCRGLRTVSQGGEDILFAEPASLMLGLFDAELIRMSFRARMVQFCSFAQYFDIILYQLVCIF
jgi:hypothetical protein